MKMNKNEMLDYLKERILCLSAIPKDYFEEIRLDTYAQFCLKHRMSAEYFVDKFIFWFFGIKNERRFR